MSKEYPEGQTIYRGDEERGDLVHIRCDTCGVRICEYHEDVLGLHEIHRTDWCEKCAPTFKLTPEAKP